MSEVIKSPLNKVEKTNWPERILDLIPIIGKKRKEREKYTELVKRVVAKTVAESLNSGVLYEHEDEKDRFYIAYYLKGKSDIYYIFTHLAKDFSLAASSNDIDIEVREDKKGVVKSFFFSMGQAKFTKESNDWDAVSYLLKIKEIDTENVHKTMPNLSRKEKIAFMNDVISSRIEIRKTNELYQQWKKESSNVCWTRDRNKTAPLLT